MQIKEILIHHFETENKVIKKKGLKTIQNEALLSIQSKKIKHENGHDSKCREQWRK